MSCMSQVTFRDCRKVPSEEETQRLFERDRHYATRANAVVLFCLSLRKAFQCDMIQSRDKYFVTRYQARAKIIPQTIFTYI